MGEPDDLEDKAIEEMIKLNVTYNLDGKNPLEAAKIVNKTLKEILRSGEIEGVTPEKAKIERQKIVNRWELVLETGSESGSTLEGADTVILHVCGVKADEEPFKLNKDTTKDKTRLPFQAGQTDTFEIMLDESIGDIFKLRFGFAKTVPKASWNIKSLKFWNPKDNDIFKTECNLTVSGSPYLDPWREVFVIWPDYPFFAVVNYLIKVHTSSQSGSMDCGVDVILFGDRGSSGRRSLRKLFGNKKKFNSGQIDEFELPVVDLGRVLKVHVFSDLSSPNQSWLLDKIEVIDANNPKDESRHWVFPCKRYFDPTKGDQQTDRILELGKPPPPEPELEGPSGPPTAMKKAGVNRKIPVKKNGLKPIEAPPSPAHESTDGDDLWEIWWENRPDQPAHKEVAVTLVLVGDKTSSPDIQMVVDLKPGLAPKRKTTSIDATSLGELQKVRLRFGDSVRAGTKWELARISIKLIRTGEISSFDFDRAIVQKPKGADSTAEASFGGLVPVRNYLCEFHLGDRTGLLEKGRVYVMIRGQRGDTGKRWLVNSAEGQNPLKTRGAIINFEVSCVDLGEIRGIRIGHDKRGKDASHYLEKAIIRPQHLDMQYLFDFSNEPRPAVPEFRGPKIEKDSSQVDFIVEYPKIQDQPEVEVYDPNEWILCWTSAPDQAFDFLQIILTLVGKVAQQSYEIDVEIGPGDSLKYKLKLDQDIGELLSVRMRHGPKVQGKHPPWKVIEMRLLNKATGQLFKFRPGIIQPPAVAKPPSPDKVTAREMATSPIRDLGEPKKYGGLKPRHIIETKGKLRKHRPLKADASLNFMQTEGQPKSLSSLKSDMIDKSIASSQNYHYQVDVYTAIRSSPLNETEPRPEMYIKFVGHNYTSDPCWFGQSLNNQTAFKPGQIDVFEFLLDDDLGAVEGVRLGLRRNAQADPVGLSVEKIVVKPLHTPSIEYSFEMGNDSVIQRGPTQWLISWVCAATQPTVLAKVALILYGGGRRRSAEVETETMLQPGESDEYLVNFVGGNEEDFDCLPYKVRVGFIDDQSGPFRWDLIYVRLRCVETYKLFTFTLTKGPVILDSDMDGWREIPVDVPPNQKTAAVINYQLDIYTSQELPAPPDAKVFVNLRGHRGDCGNRYLKRSTNNIYKNFQPGLMDSFVIEAVDLGNIRSLVIGHNETGLKQSWLFDHIMLLNRRTGELYEFGAKTWFDRSRTDGQVVRRIKPSGMSVPPPQARKWNVTLTIANFPEAGTKIPIALVICGLQNQSNIAYLTMPGEGFSPGGVYDFTINVELDDIDNVIGEVFKVRLGFTDWSTNPAVAIERLTLKELQSAAEYNITIQEWIWASSKHDSWREFYAEGGSFPPLDCVKYQVTLWTGNEPLAETDSAVYMQIEGAYGTTGLRRLASSLTHTKSFAAGQMDLFDLEALDVGEIRSITFTLAPELESDRNNWHVVRAMVMKHPMGNEEYIFECNHWLDNAAHTQSFSVTHRGRRPPVTGIAAESNYLIFVSTGPEREMAKSANVVIEIFGEIGQFGPFLLNKPTNDPLAQAFQAGTVDAFPIIIDESATGRLVKVRLQNVGSNPNWFCDKLSLYDLRRPKIETKQFEVFDWLSTDYGDGDSVKEFPIEYVRMAPLKTSYYTVEVENGPQGTPLIDSANITCYIELIGGSPLTSGIRPLRKNADRNLLHQPGKVNVFSLSAVGVGDITKIRLGHTAVSSQFKWHVVNVTVSFDRRQRIFSCNKVLSKSQSDKVAEVVIETSMEKPMLLNPFSAADED